MALNSSKSSVGQPDFLERWKFSDVDLLAEDQKFYVHHSTLSMWSPVFERMLMSEFKIICETLKIATK